MDSLLYFTSAECNLLLKLLMAHLCSDFVFQTRKMVEDKRWNSRGLLLHIVITMLLVFLFTWSLPLTLFIGGTHYLIDLSKTKLSLLYPHKSFLLFGLDQMAHIVILILAWVLYYGKQNEFISAIETVFTNNNFVLVTLGYFFCIWPSSYIVRFAVQSLLNTGNTASIKNEKIENGGRWIGQFERVIILTFVLLSQYEAIGFLITGKSIIRFADREHLKSEYVLAGTMLSYALAIGSGALINYFLK